MNIFNQKNKNSSQENVQAGSFLSSDIFNQQKTNIDDILAPSSLKISQKHVEIGNRYARTLAIVSYPRYLSQDWFSGIINLGKEFDISIFIHPTDTRQVLRKFRKKTAQVESQIIERQERGLVRDPELDIAFQDLERLRDSLQEATEKIFNVGVYITIYGDSFDDLEGTERSLRSILESQLIFIKSTYFQQEQGLKSTFPLGNDVLGIYTKINTQSLTSIFPFVSFNIGSDSGILYGLNRHDGSLILFDRFKLPNYNSVTFGTSGSGKSFSVKLEALRSFMLGAEIIIIDPENEFIRLAEVVGGRSFNISLTSEHHINPFDLPLMAEDEDSTRVLRDQIIYLVGFFRILLGGFTKEEDAIIDKAITETYSFKDIQVGSNFQNIDPPLLSDFEIILKNTEGGGQLANKLSKYTTGSWAGFINNPTNIDVRRKFIVFSVRDMEPDLKTAAMHMVSWFVWGNIKKNLQKRLLIVDEAWIMMQSEDTASFLYGLVKRGRKYYLGVATVTQDVNDFLKSEYGKPILNNSSIMLLLRQSPTNITLVQKTFDLTNSEKYELLEAQTGNGILVAGLKRVAVQVIASLTEEKFITSNPEDILALKKSAG